jgi:hypothetical protein
MKAQEVLNKAKRLMDERGKQYDQPEGERSMLKTIHVFNTITGHSLSEAEGWLLQQILKDVRQWQREDYHADSAEDCVAYSALKAEALAREGALQKLADALNDPLTWNEIANEFHRQETKEEEHNAVSTSYVEYENEMDKQLKKQVWGIDLAADYERTDEPYSGCEQCYCSCGGK